MRPKQTREQKQLDQRVEAIVRRRCSGMAINIMDIGQVFDAARTAHREGRDVEAAVVDTYTVLSAGTR